MHFHSYQSSLGSARKHPKRLASNRPRHSGRFSATMRTLGRVGQIPKSPTHFGFSSAGPFLDFRLSNRKVRNFSTGFCFMHFFPNRKAAPQTAIENLKCHLMTLVAFISVPCGIVTPICLAVLRLITNSNFIGCSTGRSAGLAPLRILST
jgi:hypothetical protein